MRVVERRPGLPARHLVELRIQLPRLELGLGLDLLPAFPPAGVGRGEDIPGGAAFGLAQLLFLGLAIAVGRFTFFFTLRALVVALVAEFAGFFAFGKFLALVVDGAFDRFQVGLGVAEGTALQTMRDRQADRKRDIAVVDGFFCLRRRRGRGLLSG